MLVGCNGQLPSPEQEEAEEQICCKTHALEWAQDRADAELYPFCVWWVMGSGKYLVRADGVRPRIRHVVREATVKPR